MLVPGQVRHLGGRMAAPVPAKRGGGVRAGDRAAVRVRARVGVRVGDRVVAGGNSKPNTLLAVL